MKLFDIGMMHIPLGGMFIAVYRKFYRAPFMTVCGTRLLLLIEDVDETTRAGSTLGLLAIEFNKDTVQQAQTKGSYHLRHRVTERGPIPTPHQYVTVT